MRRSPSDSWASQAPLLSFEDVSKRFPDGGRQVVVLDRVSFEMESADSVGVYGAARSGKSTMLRLAACIEAPDSGRVCFAGRDVTAISPRERARLLRSAIALVTSDCWEPVPGETVLEHVATSLGSEGVSLREAKRRALETLDAVGVSAVGAAESTVSLSADERARLMLARALVRDPKLLIIDEPGPMPRLSERDRFCALIREAARARGVAVLVASEDMSALQGMGILMRLSRGDLCSSEPPSKVVRLPSREVSASGSS